MAPATPKIQPRSRRSNLGKMLALELSNEERLLVMLHYRDRLSFDQIAHTMGVTRCRIEDIYQSVHARADARARRKRREANLANLSPGRRAKRKKAQRP